MELRIYGFNVAFFLSLNFKIFHQHARARLRVLIGDDKLIKSDLLQLIYIHQIIKQSVNECM